MGLMLKQFIIKLFSFFKLSIINSEKLTKIDIEGKKARHEVEKLNFIFLNERILNPSKLYSHCGKITVTDFSRSICFK